MKVKRTANRLYRIYLQIASLVCLLASLEDQAWLWHARLGHVNFHALKMLEAEYMAAGVPQIKHPDQLCQACVVVKQARTPFPVIANNQADEPLELVHADLSGPITPSTLAGNSYFMLIVDDYNRWMWVYVIKSKDQVSSLFKNFKADSENMCGCRIKTLRTDHGREFISSELGQICEQTGIV